MSFCKHRVMDKCKKDGRPCIYSEECFEPEEQKPKTNADHIRSMTDEELAEWIYNGASSDPCDYCTPDSCFCDGATCRGKADAEIIADWLKQPYKEDVSV